MGYVGLGTNKMYVCIVKNHTAGNNSHYPAFGHNVPMQLYGRQNCWVIGTDWIGVGASMATNRLYGGTSSSLLAMFLLLYQGLPVSRCPKRTFLSAWFAHFKWFSCKI